MRLWRMPKEDWHEIGSMSGPIFIEQLAMALLGMLVSMLVKSTGIAAVAAVNLLNALNMLFQQTYMAIGIAVTVTVAQHRGRGDLEATGKTAAQSMTLSMLITTFLAILCFLFVNPILRLILMDSEALVYQYSRIYYFYCVLSLPFLSVYYVSTSAIRGSGYPIESLIATLINNGSYALLAIVSVTLFRGGLMAVSVCMLLSRVFAAFAGLYYLKKGNENMRVQRAFVFRFEKRIIKPVVTVAVPICMENLLFQGGRMITQTYAVPFGTNAIAVNGIVGNLNVLLIVTGTTASNAVTPVVGRYVGMRDYEKARQKQRQFFVLSTIAAAFSATLIYFLTPPLARFYSTNPEVQNQIIKVTASMCLLHPFFWTGSFVTPSGLRGAGDVKYTTLMAILSMLLTRIALGYVFAVVLKMSVMGIWLGMYIDWVLRMTLFMLRSKGDKWLQQSIIE